MRLLTGLLVLALLTGCSSFAANRIGGDEDGYIYIAADAEGMRAWGDSQIGLVNETKNDPAVKSSYYQMREKQEETKGLRFRRVANEQRK